jgi:hypothetical protein
MVQTEMKGLRSVPKHEVGPDEEVISRRFYSDLHKRHRGSGG